MNLRPYLDFASEVAYKAGQITLGYFNTGIRPDFKPDDTPVTAADRAAEEFIRTEIENVFPDHAILGEEFGSSEKKNMFRWIIDPIDGTKTFMRGVPLYAVLIGLEIEGQMRVGASYFPALDEMLCAADGEGCWWNGRRSRVSDVGSLDEGYICYTNIRNMYRYNRGEAWERLNRKAYASRGWSDAYGYLLVATGRSEVMLDPIMSIWDCSPFPPIFREAGGYFGSWDGQPGHTFNEALACNASILDEVLSVIKG